MVQREASTTRRCQLLFVRGVGSVSRLCGVVAAMMILMSVVITCQMIWVRFVMNESTIWQTEAVTFLMISATLIGLPYVQLLKGHVNVDLLPMLLPPLWRKVLVLVVLSLSIVVIAIMTYHGFELFHVAWERNWRSETVWGVSLWIPYSALPIGLGMFSLQMVADLVAAWRCDADVLGQGEFEEDY
jgi:TRAP-type C4-dicarboxylate transport system permease small subunit